MAKIAELDLSDVSDALPPELAKPTEAVFAAAVAVAARQNRKVLAAAESREAATKIGEQLAPIAYKLLASTASQNHRLGGFGVKVRVTAFRKAPPGYYKEPANIVLGWLQLPHRLLDRKGKDIIAALQERYSGYPVRNDFMSRRLHWRQSRHLQKLMADQGIAANHADCQTLSGIRKRIKDHHNPSEYDVYKPVIMIAKDESHIIWNSERYSIFRNGDVPTIKRHGKRVALSAIRRVLGE